MEQQTDIFKGKIITVATNKVESVCSDSILVEFMYDNKKVAHEMLSQFMDEKNIREWRRLILSVIWEQCVKLDDGALDSFENSNCNFYFVQAFVPNMSTHLNFLLLC